MSNNRIDAARLLGVGLLVSLLCFIAPSALAGSKDASRTARQNTGLLTESTSPSLKRAVRAWHRDNYEMAIRHTDVALGHKLLRADRELALAISCALRREVGEVEAGLAHCDQLVELTDGRDGRHLNSRGNARMRAGDVEAAVLDYQAALALAAETETFGMAEQKLVRRNLARAMDVMGSESQHAVASAPVRYRPMSSSVSSSSTMPASDTTPPAAPAR